MGKLSNIFQGLFSTRWGSFSPFFTLGPLERFLFKSQHSELTLRKNLPNWFDDQIGDVCVRREFCQIDNRCTEIFWLQ